MTRFFRWSAIALTSVIYLGTAQSSGAWNECTRTFTNSPSIANAATDSTVTCSCSPCSGSVTCPSGCGCASVCNLETGGCSTRCGCSNFDVFRRFRGQKQLANLRFNLPENRVRPMLENIFGVGLADTNRPKSLGAQPRVALSMKHAGLSDILKRLRGQGLTLRETSSK
jgi:hypothetical protein